jgi:hypothetical protein
MVTRRQMEVGLGEARRRLRLARIEHPGDRPQEGAFAVMVLPDDRGEHVEIDAQSVDTAEILDRHPVDLHASNPTATSVGQGRLATTIGSARPRASVAPLATVNTFRALLWATAVVWLILALATPAVAQEAEPAALPERVLFIGNSHSDRHGGLDWLVGNMVAAEDPPRPFEGTTRTASGVTLEYHYRTGAVDAIRDGHYDAVVLQGHLPGAAVPSTAPFLEYAGKLHAAVAETGAPTILFMTWPQERRDWAELEDYVAAHRQAEADFGAQVAPVGVAFANAAAARPDLALLSEDGIHATWEGAYLAAATVYATLFDRSPVGLPYAFGLSEDDAAFLQSVAWQTLSDWRAGIPAAD